MEDYFDRLKRMIIARLMINETSIHGVSHWDRVTENGLHVAQHTGADIAVVKLFAIFHDAQRKNDEDDPDHGRRGAELARDLRQRYFALSDAQFDLLYKACAGHTDGAQSSDLTIGTCWDADRLDLDRIGISPSHEYMSTTIGKALAKERA